MHRSLLLILVLSACTVQPAQHADVSAQERLTLQDMRPRTLKDGQKHVATQMTDARRAQFGGQSGEPTAPPTDGFDNTPASPEPPSPPPTHTDDTDDAGLIDSDNDGVPDTQDPDFQVGDTSDTGDTGE